MLTLISEKEVALLLAKRIRELRLSFNFSQKTLANKSGVNYSTLRVFEDTGQISLTNLLLLSATLGRLDEIAALFKPAKPQAIIELTQPSRKRGRK